ncbi:hypothetical protein BGX38DRAFT_1281046 [Terfezia claveryi]|nr:hypothetical protein BGX38DRAFT_1281046 [Terfezia claveryi]
MDSDMTQNPTCDSPDSPTPTADCLTPEIPKTSNSLLEYLDSHRHASFPVHVLSVEALLNKCITNSRAGIALLKLYITFRAAPKMNWRFNSLTLTSFSRTLQSLTLEEVSGIIHQNNLTISIGGEGEQNLITDILHSIDVDLVKAEYPYLYKQWQSDSQAIYDDGSVLLMYTLTLAKKYVASLISTLKLLSSVPKALLYIASKWMICLHKLIHHSPIFQAHIGALESLVVEK